MPAAQPLGAITGAPLPYEIEGHKLHRIGLAELGEFRDWIAMQPVRRTLALIREEGITDVQAKQIMLDRAYRESEKLTEDGEKFEARVQDELKTPSAVSYLIYRSLAKGCPSLTFPQVAGWLSLERMDELRGWMERIMGLDPQSGQSQPTTTLAGGVVGKAGVVATEAG